MDSRDVRLFAGLSRIAEIESLQERVLAIARDLVAWGLRKVDVRIIDDWNEVVRGEAGASPLSWEMAPDAAARRRLFQALAAFEEDGISQACGALLERSAPLFTIEGDARESCLLFLQLIAATRTVGLVIIDSGYPEPPDREIGALLRAYCDVAATLFDNERSAQRVRREAERSEVLARIGELTRRSLDRRTMLEHVVGHVREAFKAARCVFYERDKANPRLVHVVAIDDAKSIRAPFPKTHEMVPGGYLEAMLDRGQTVALESLSEAAPHERRVRSYGMRAVLAGPIHALEGP
ncbi:MAG: GAF domain-containing protein, partial [Candidatus Eremiobacteraeota bacterium]|nr:GAF domain-containing protein [Candidatus Eremiobacteraeota bacterium]